MEPAAGAWCDGTSVLFRLPDKDQRLSSVRLRTPVFPGPPPFAWVDATRTWELRLPRPPVQRIEYRLELIHPDGGREFVADPDNPRRFNDASVLWCAGYREPGWLELPPIAGSWREIYLPLPALRGEMVARIWSPAEARPRASTSRGRAGAPCYSGGSTVADQERFS